MKHIKHFENYSDFENSKNSLVKPNVSFIKEGNNKIVEYLPNNQQGGGSTEPIVANLCDIAYWDGSKVKTVSKDKWNDNLGKAIGVVVIPSDMLQDGRARMVCLMPSDSTGAQTSSYIDLSWQKNPNSITNTGYVDVPEITNYDRIPTTDNLGSTTTSSAVMGYLPSDKFAIYTSFVDPKTAYYGDNVTIIPSPYLGDDKTFNPAYSETISGYNNALSDFNGLGNTEILVGLGSKYQAAIACWNYQDGSDSNVQWYLPAMGELGFLMPRFNEINNVITSLGGVGLTVESSLGSRFWSSSEYNNKFARWLYADYGYVTHYEKNNSYYFRAFALV